MVAVMKQRDRDTPHCLSRTKTHQQLQGMYFCYKSSRTLSLYVMSILLLLLSLCVHGQQFECSPANVQDPNQCTSGETYLNRTSQCCQTCSVCPSDMEVETPCSLTQDTQCVTRCPHRCLYWDENEAACVLDCTCCPNSQCNFAQGRCECDPDCYLSGDLFCDEPVLCNGSRTSQPPVDTGRGSSSQSSLPPWGIGLVAIGIVIGIVAFSACFLLMGIVSTTRKGDIEIQGSENSESGLVSSGLGSRGNSSLGTNSTYMSAGNASAFLNNPKLLELLRNSNAAHSHSSLNSVRSSPKSTRSSDASPRPVRTVHVTMKSASSSGTKTTV